MKRTVYLLFIILIFSFLANENVMGQNESQLSELNQNDSIESNYGNLYQLTQNIYKSFLIYTTGSSKLFEGREHPLVLKHSGEKLIGMSKKELETTPISNIESIEVVYNPKMNPVFYGTISLTCLIKVKLKEQDKKSNH